MNRFIERVPLILFSIFTLKLLILNGWSFENSLVLLVLGSIVALFEMQFKSKEVSTLNKTIETLQQDMKLMKDTQERLNGSISSLKLSSNIKSQGNALRL